MVLQGVKSQGIHTAAPIDLIRGGAAEERQEQGPGSKFQGFWYCVCWYTGIGRLNVLNLNWCPENTRSSIFWRPCDSVGNNPVQPCWLTVQGEGGFRAVKCRCTGKGDTGHEDYKSSGGEKKGQVGWSWRTETVRVIKWTIILIRTVCCWEAHICNPRFINSWISHHPASTDEVGHTAALSAHS